MAMEGGRGHCLLISIMEIPAYVLWHQEYILCWYSRGIETISCSVVKHLFVNVICHRESFL